MTTLEGRLLIRGELVPGRLRLDGERIAAVEPARVLAKKALPIVAPGFVDLHVHGFGGAGPDDDLPGMARALARAGTTAFLATLFPAEPRRLGDEAERIWRAARELDDPAAARVLGLHLEGPFVSPRAAGALDVASLAEPSPAALAAILGPGGAAARGIRTMTVAPELPGALDLVQELAQSGVRPSLGHSHASVSEARAAAARGASAATHLFNAMGPLHHREAGLAGFALSSDALCAEIIGDLVHVGREAFELALRARGPLGLALISDALHPAGTACDAFHAHGKRIELRDGAAWMADEDGTPRLAGAAASQMEAIRRLVGRGVVSLPEALRMASEAPAHALGLDAEHGILAPGFRADLVVIEEAEGGPRLREVWLRGRALLARPRPTAGARS